MRYKTGNGFFGFFSKFTTKEFPGPVLPEPGHRTSGIRTGNNCNGIPETETYDFYSSEIIKMAEAEENHLDEVLKSNQSGKATPPLNQDDLPGATPTPPLNQDDLPGSADDEGALANQEKRPSTTLEIDPEEGVATMSESSAPPTRLPPLVVEDGLEKFLDMASSFDEV